MGLDFYINPLFTFQSVRTIADDEHPAAPDHEARPRRRTFGITSSVDDDGSIAIYVNALQINAQSSATLVPPTKASLLHTRKRSLYENAFIGVFDEAAIYDHALSGQ